MTDALNPLLPVGGTQVEIASELRGIKSRLVADKGNIETLQVQIAPVTGAGAIGLEILDAPNSTTALDALDATTVGKQLFQIADIAAAKALLGIVSQIETTTTSGGRTTIVLGGGLMINIISASISDAVEQHYWLTPFTSAVFGGWITLDSGTNAAWLQGLSLTDCYTDQANASPHNGYILAIGK